MEVTRREREKEKKKKEKVSKARECMRKRQSMRRARGGVEPPKVRAGEVKKSQEV